MEGPRGACLGGNSHGRMEREGGGAVPPPAEVVEVMNDRIRSILNRMPDSRFAGPAIGRPEPEDQTMRCRTRELFVRRMLSEAVAFQVENQNPEPDLCVEPMTDEELQHLIDDIRTELASDEPLKAYVLADRLRQWLLWQDYCDDEDLPTYNPRG